MGSWNLADCFDLIAEVRGDADALIQGERRISWRDVERRSGNIAAWFVEHGGGRQSKVAIYTYNDPGYMEAVYASAKAAMVPVNVNYRYRERELHYLLENSDAEFVIVHEEFAPLLAKIQSDLPKLRGSLVIGPDADDAAKRAGLSNAFAYEEIAERDRPQPDVTRSGDDLLLLYTGGTTGMPKGVMWRQDDLYNRLGGGGLGPSPEDHDALRTFVENPPMPMRSLIAPPLMHGTGWFTAVISWLAGGTIILLDDPRKFDAEDLWSCVERNQTTTITIVGDSFAKPMLRTLQQSDRSYDLSSIRMIVSSGVMWSRETKLGILEFNPQIGMVDSLGSSEALGMGMSITTSGGESRTAKFQLSENTRLFDENLVPIETAPGAVGLIGVGGFQPVGYYKDPEKSARTFVEADGTRFSIPGDWVEVDTDGVSLNLLGRGSVCINTGGEKVFPEEVEEAVKRFPAVRDAVVVGVPDEKWGEAIVAVVSCLEGDLDAEEVKRFVKGELAAYKAPKHIVFVDSVYRSPAGKADFKRTRQVALAALGIET